LAPEGITKSISGPRPKKVVHHWSTLYSYSIYTMFPKVSWV